MIELLAQRTYGFEGTTALIVFTVCFIAVVGLTLAVVRLPAIGWLVAGVLMATALTAPTNSDRTAYLPTWILPLQKNRAEMQLACGVLLALLLVGTGKLNLAKLPVQGWLMLVLGLFMGTMQFVHDTATNAGMSLAFAVATIPSAGIAARLICDLDNGPLKVTRLVMVVASFWAGACCVQFVINPEYLLNSSGRFNGMLGNPQHAGMFIAPVLMLSMWGLLNDPNKRFRVLWFGLLGIYMLFAGWTGSRACAAMSVIGWIAVLWSRLGKFALFLPFAAVLVYGLSFLAEELQIGANLERLTSDENTREGAWDRQLEDIANSPLIGVGWNDVGATENSYLGLFAGYGVMGFLLALTLLFYSMVMCARLWIVRRLLPPVERSLVNTVIGFNALYFAGANFEGYMLGRSSVMQAFLIIFAGLGSYLLQRAAQVDRGEISYLPEDQEPGHGEAESSDSPRGRTPYYA